MPFWCYSVLYTRLQTKASIVHILDASQFSMWGLQVLLLGLKYQSSQSFERDQIWPKHSHSSFSKPLKGWGLLYSYLQRKAKRQWPHKDNANRTKQGFEPDLTKSSLNPQPCEPSSTWKQRWPSCGMYVLPLKALNDKLVTILIILPFLQGPQGSTSGSIYPHNNLAR